MTKNIRTQTGKIIGKTLNAYHSKLKPKVDDLKFKEQYQGRIIDCMVGEVDDNYIETPSTDNPIVKLEHSKEGVVKVPSMKGKTILVDAEGNETDTPSEGCRLVSVGENEGNKITILSKNKNLFRIEETTYTENVSGVNIKFDAENQKIIFNGTVTEDVYMYINHRYVYNVGNFIKNEKYQISVITDGSYSLPNDKNEVVYFAFCGGTYSWLRKDGIIINAQNMIATEENPKSWMRIRQGTTFNNFGVKIQVENKQNATRYEPHKYHKTEILLDKPLRSLPNGIYDEIVNNKLIRRIGKVVLDGSENWRLNIQLSNSKGYYCFYYTGIIDGKMGNEFYPILSNRFVSQIGVGGNAIINKMDSEWVAWHGWSFKVNICVNGDRLVTRDVDGFKQWLSENPTEVLYELAEPIIIEMPNTLTLQGFNDTTMYIENSITPTVQYGYNALIPYKKELKTQQQEVETNTLDIERNIIPYLMDMEMNLMLMED